MKDLKPRLVARLLFLYYLLLRWTVRIEKVGADEVLRESERGLAPVFATPHYALLAVVLAWDGFPATLLASMSKDGELAASLMERRGFRMVRGSSSRGGREALAELVAVARAGGPVGITFDGPRGPALKPKAGVAVVAREASGSVFLAFAEVLPSPFLRRPLAIRLRSWDRFLLPLPFARMRVHHERVEPVGISKEAGEPWVAEMLRLLEERARLRCAG